MKWMLALLLASPAMAQKAIMEQVPSSAYAIKVDTQAGRVDIATTSYQWGIANVGLHVASNVVVDALSSHNAVVIYATGTASLSGNYFSVGRSTFVVRGGYVGIGTASPLRLLDINTTLSATPGSGDIGFNNVGTEYWSMRNDGAANFSLDGYNGAWFSGLFINRGTTYVGIGTTNPGSQLDVAGTIRQSAVISCTGGLTTNGSGDISGCNAGVGTGDVIKAGLNVMTGTTTWPVSPSTPTANGLFQGMFANVAVNFVGATGAINYSVNVSSVTHPGTGQFQINFARSFANANYACFGGTDMTNDNQLTAMFGTTAGPGWAAAAKGTASIGVLFRHSVAGSLDPLNGSVICFGAQ